MRKRGIKLLVLVVLIGALSGGVWAAVTEAPVPQVQTAPALATVPSQPGKPAWLTPEKEAALVEVRKILKEARQVAEGIELPNRLTTSGMILKDLQAGKDALIKEIEKAQFRVGDFSTAAATKQPWYLVFAQVKYGWIDEAVATAAQTKLDAGTLLVLIGMLADTGHLDAASKIAGANLAKEQVTDWRYRDEAVVFALLARELARAGDSRAKETLRRAMQAAQKVKLSDDRALAFMHVARAQAAIGDHTGSIESFRQAEREIPARSEMPVIVGRLQQIGKAQLEGGQRMEGEETLQRAIQLTAGLEPLSRAALLGCVAWTRFVTGDESNAGQLLERTVGESKGLSPAHRVKVLYNLGRWQLGLHQKEAALQTARLMKEAVEAIEEEKEKANALSMARNFAVQAGDVDTAFALIEITNDDYEKLDAMRHLAMVLVAAQERDRIHSSSVIKKLAEEAPVLAKKTTFKDEGKRRFAHKAAAVIQAANGNIEGALETIERISDDDFSRSYAYPEITRLLVRQGNLAGARQVSGAYQGKWIFARSLVQEIRNLAATQTKTISMQESLNWANQLTSDYARPYALIGVADAFLEQNQIGDSNALLPKTPLQRSCPSVSELF